MIPSAWIMWGCAAAIATAVCAASASLASGEKGDTFRIRRDRGAWWYVAPSGRRFFSFGVCCVNRGARRDEYRESNPEYAAFLRYPSDAAWAAETLRRLRQWGFTTVGGWSDYECLLADPDAALPVTPVIHAGSTAGLPWLDMWDPAVLARVEDTVRSVIGSLRSSPFVLGYYADNELGWWNHALVQMTLEMPSASMQRRKVVQLLERHYTGDWQRLLRDFDPEGAGSFADFRERGKLFLRPGGGGARVERRVLRFLAERYYAVTTAAIRRHDPRRLVLGDRFQSFYYPEVARAAGKYLDVVSTNLNAHWVDGTFAPFYLETLHDLTRRPVQIGEFYMCAQDNRSGNKNSSGSFPVVATQRERADGFRTTALELARLSYVVGADWFQYYDEPTYGRPDGEDYNMGLVDIRDLPYEELTAASASLDLTAVHQAAEDRTPRAVLAPPAPPDPLARFDAMHAMLHWDRNAGRVSPATKYPVADLYVCWNARNLYIGLVGMNLLEDAAYRSGSVPECDRSLLTIRVGKQRRAVQVRFGSGKPAVADDGRVLAVTAAGTASAVVAKVAVVVPCDWVGASELAAGQAVPLDVTLDTAGRCDHVRWKARVTLSSAGQPATRLDKP